MGKEDRIGNRRIGDWKLISLVPEPSLTVTFNITVNAVQIYSNQLRHGVVKFLSAIILHTM